MLLLFMAAKDDIIAQQAKQIADLLDRVSDLELQLAKALKKFSNPSKGNSTLVFFLHVFHLWLSLLDTF